MASSRSKSKALIIAGFISLLMIAGIANMSYATQQKSVLEFDQPAVPCSLIFCSLV